MWFNRSMNADLIYIVGAFIVLWLGAGLSINGVEKVSKYIRISSFVVSYFALGLLTSSSEISVAYFAILDKTPGVSVGNLIGGSTVLLLLIIPLLAVLNKKLKFDEKTEPINFPLALLVISLPVFLILDKNLSTMDAFIMIASVVFLAFSVSQKSTIFSKIEDFINHRNINVMVEGVKILVGVGLVIVACKYIVDTAILYADRFSVSPFLVGLLVLSIGTNLPELTILVRSTLFKKKTIALGDYVGSAALNTLTLGFVVLFSNGSVTITEGLKLNILLLPIGGLLFLIFTRDKKLERLEGMLLLIMYAFFVAYEILG